MKELKQKYHVALIRKIKSIAKVNTGQFLKAYSVLNGIETTLKPDKNRFSVDFNVGLFDDTRKQIKLGKTYKKIGLKTKEQNLVLEELYINGRGITDFSGSINQLYTKGYSKKKEYYYRCIIPIKKELIFRFHIEQTSYSTDLGIRSSLCTELNFEKSKIELYSIKDKPNHYAVIEIDTKMTFEKFSQVVFAVLVSYGYATGFMPGDKGFYAAYTNRKMEDPKHLYFTSMRESSNSHYRPVNSNSFGVISEKGKLAEKFYKSLRPISINEFSNLFELVHNNLDFSSVLLLIIETSNASLLFMTGGYSIALETLSKLITNGKTKDLIPIKDKTLRDKVIKDCITVINDNCATVIDSESLRILSLRIETTLNNPTNKDQLQKPFFILGIELLDKDLDTINMRNEFLHGRTPKVLKGKPLKAINEHMYYYSIRLYTLLNMLILKWVGYDNYVVNYPKIAENGTNIKLPKEKPFRKV
jgi:hypothetical protein